MATHSSILAWRIPWRTEPCGLQSIGSQRVRHDWSDLACTCAYIYIYILKCVCIYIYIYIWHITHTHVCSSRILPLPTEKLSRVSPFFEPRQNLVSQWITCSRRMLGDFQGFPKSDTVSAWMSLVMLTANLATTMLWGSPSWSQQWGHMERSRPKGAKAPQPAASMSKQQACQWPRLLMTPVPALESSSWGPHTVEGTQTIPTMPCPKSWPTEL